MQVATSKTKIPRGQYIINNLKMWPLVIVSKGARESCLPKHETRVPILISRSLIKERGLSPEARKPLSLLAGERVWLPSRFPLVLYLRYQTCPSSLREAPEHPRPQQGRNKIKTGGKKAI